ncbi:chemotaxis protein CheB, partial [Alienimonas sp. DA493]|uniref:chemotaxis protein CheB n=1 Tax=Alienimonas sp. DA493 TaxID=3373605 RepID=UPI003753ED29
MSVSDEVSRGNSEDRQPDDAARLVIGIGASAGGLEAFRQFFERMPADSGTALVLVQHLDPDHDSIMPELLARSTAMPVRHVVDETAIERNHVYVIPPNCTLTIEEGVLRTRSPFEPHGQRMPIDNFFRSLAEDQGDRAVGVVLSGAGSDGTLGLKAIREHGGLTLAQEPATAQYDSMPRSAAEAGAVDRVLPVEEMPELLRQYARHRQLTAEGGEDGGEALLRQADGHLADVFRILQRRTGHDFSGYKKGTILRRIRRRMQVVRASTIERYVDHLRESPEEPRELFKDLLIGVTGFFRDEEAFAALERDVLSVLLDRKRSEDSLRIWAPGCSTGEEPYSIAMLVREALSRAGKPLPVQIFATDIDEQALKFARQARYPEGIVEQVTRERLERHFVKEGAGYRVAKDIREMCIFSPHNLIRDPPFSRLDLISCRNLLIYLDAALQKTLLRTFRYALSPSGFLFLGSSGSVSAEPDLFKPVEKSLRLFQAADPLRTRNLPLPLAERERDRPTRPPTTTLVGEPEHERGVGARFERLLLDRFAPASAVVDRHGTIAYASGRTGRYLELPAGTPDLNLASMVRQDLRLSVRVALHEAVEREEEVVQRDLSIGIGGQVQRLNLIVRPLEKDRFPGLFMVVFEELASPVELSTAPDGQAAPAGDQQEEIEQLRKGLRSTKEFLQNAIERLEASNQDLQGSNEELLSLNEELQSANEELQTSQEELQSVNEELQTVNVELNNKVEELDSVNSDLQNLLRSTQVPTLFIDRELRIKKFTPVASEVFNLQEGDVGRPLTDITRRFVDGDLGEHVRRVLKTLTVFEEEVRRPEGDRWFLLRIMPYRTVKDVIDGVVLTFGDITEQKRAQEEVGRLNAELKQRVDELETTLELLPVGIAICTDGAGEQISVNRSGAEMLGLRPGANASKSGPPGHSAAYRVFRDGREVDPAELPIQQALATGEPVATHDLLVERADGRRLELRMAALPLHADDGETRGAVGAMIDVTELRQAERRASARARQQAVVAELGSRALAGEDLPALMQAAVEAVTETLGSDLSKVLRLESGERLLLLAGVGWNEGLIGRAYVDADDRSQAGYTLKTDTPVIVEDLSTESRFQGPALLTDHDVVSGMSVVIHGVNGHYGVLGTHSRRRHEFTDDDAQFLQSVANVLGGAVRNYLDRQELERVQLGLEDQVRERTIQLRELASEITVSEQRERRRVSKLLHDHLQQLLVAAKMRVQYAVAGGTESVMQEVHDLIDESLTASRSLAVDLSPPVLQDSGLRHGVEWLARQMAEKHGLQVEIAGDDEGELPDDLKAFAFDAVRELLFNVVKHSGQAKAIVEIRRGEGGRLEVSVRDPGVGMSEDALREARPRPEGLGLFSIRERLEHLGGNFDLESPADGEFSVRMLLPAEEEAAARDVDPLPVPTEAARGGDTRPEDSRIRIVVVDD